MRYAQTHMTHTHTFIYMSYNNKMQDEIKNIFIPHFVPFLSMFTTVQETLEEVSVLTVQSYPVR